MMKAGSIFLICIGLTACGSFAPTAWIGKNTPEDVGEGKFPKLSDIPARPELSASSDERRQMALEMAKERDRIQQTAQTIFQDGEDQDGENQVEAP